MESGMLMINVILAEPVQTFVILKKSTLLHSVS